MLPPYESSVSLPLKRKTFTSQHDVKGFQKPSPPQPTKLGNKFSKKGSNDRTPHTSQPPESSPSDSSGNEYQALRRKYLLLEEQKFGIGKELSEIEDEVKTLEEEKLALLDELVVLEGLINTSELQSRR